MFGFYEVTREEYAKLSARRLRGELPAEKLAEYRIQPYPNQWEWWRRKFYGYYGIWKRGECPRLGRCIHCHRITILHHTPSMTQYCWDGTGKDPNADFFLCRYGRDEYIENMNERWAEYRSGLM